MRTKKIFNKVCGVLGAIVIALEMIAILFFILVKLQGGVPSLFGYNMYVIVSPSMTPELEVGDVIISRVYDGQELAVGDIVQYVGKSGSMSGKIITHEIIYIEGSGQDATIITKGLANPEADSPIERQDVIAVMQYKTVLLDKFYWLISHTWGFICLVILPMTAMIVYEIMDLARSIRKEKEEIEKGEGEREQSDP